ncbi:hypothetical protein SAMN05444004_1266 [Jannaschia faecimaris]|uniref:Uncharacterized protein n=1 Tax=Jannaschia faecimaris TaxID=1244108 RepID=A0A1H3U9R2_9RHOB|nr:hypothetical protein [Jannaschia faecimaris]SDZ58831.1 hypothetical protein SAMN05444004_1266 [Jannaschia faecimaris]
MPFVYLEWAFVLVKVLCEIVAICGWIVGFRLGLCFGAFVRDKCRKQFFDWRKFGDGRAIRESAIATVWCMRENSLYSIWSMGRYWPDCGSVTSTARRGTTCPSGQYQGQGCWFEFTVNICIPMHSTKLDLIHSIYAMFLALTSSKGISLVVMARLPCGNQKNVWNIGCAIREMMDDQNGDFLPLIDIVEVDETYAGGMPRSLS